MKLTIKLVLLTIIFSYVLHLEVFAQQRKYINLPDIPGYLTLKGDFHMHTPFSDGSVWPSDRVLEAWRDGMDIIAITDHVEYSPNADDITKNLNRPYEIAKPVADEHGIILIRAAEITRQMPPGHFNAFFLNDVNALKKTDYMESFSEAAKQGAFFVWNHPGWKAQQPDTTIWFPIHTEFYNKGWLNGIEVMNEKEFYPNALKWATEKNLTIFANTDIHGPIDFTYQIDKGEKRPFTIVFSKERSVEGIKDAFVNHRTAAFFKDTLVGSEELLRPLINACIKVETPIIDINDKGNATLLLSNPSDFPIKLQSIKNNNFQLPHRIDIPARSSVSVQITNANGFSTGIQEVSLAWKVLNVLINKDSLLQIQVNIQAFAWGQIQIGKNADESWKISCDNVQKEIIIRYTTDGQIPCKDSPTIDQSFQHQNKVNVTMACYQNGTQIGTIHSKDITLHKALGGRVTLTEAPSHTYAADGGITLTNGIQGSIDYKDGMWLGFQHKDLEAIVELEKAQQINNIQITFLEILNSWIFAPLSVQIQTSMDGIHYKLVEQIPIKPAAEGSSRGIISVAKKKNFGNIKFIKILAKNTGIIPAWHTAAGKNAWLFVDEIQVY